MSSSSTHCRLSLALDKQKSVAYPQSSWTNAGSLGELVREYCLPQQNKPETLQGLALEMESPSREERLASVLPTLCPPDSTCPLGSSQCDHRCPPCSHLASAQPLLLVSLSRGETCWNLQSTFLNTKGELWGSENKEAKECRLSSAYRVCGPTGLAHVQSDFLAVGQPELAACPLQPTTQARVAPQAWAHPRTQTRLQEVWLPLSHPLSACPLPI